MILTNKLVRVFAVALIFAALLLALSNNSTQKGIGSIPTASADAISISAKFDPITTIPGVSNLVVKGDNPAKGHTGEVTVNSFDHMTAAPVSLTSSSGITSGKPSNKDITFTKNLDSASISLYQIFTAGATIPTITFTFQKVGSSDFYQVTYTNVKISSIDQTATPNTGIVETVTFVPSKTTWNNLTNSSSFGWDFVNTKVS